MKFCDIVQEPFFLTTEDAARAIGSPKLFEYMIAARWIKPCVDKHRLRLWDPKKVEECANKIKMGEYPEAKS